MSRSSVMASLLPDELRLRVSRTCSMSTLSGLRQLLLGYPELHRERDELRLGAVVKVPLDPSERRCRGVDRLSAGCSKERTRTAVASGASKACINARSR